MTEFQNSDIFAAMQTGSPYRTYKKAILGKVYLTILDPFSLKPDGIILFGNPRNNDKNCFFSVWSVQEDVFLRKVNEVHFEKGTIVEWSTEQKEGKKQYSAYTEAEVTDIVNSHYVKLQSVLNTIDSEAFLIRLLNKAEDLEKSEKITTRIQARLAELQYGKASE